MAYDVVGKVIGIWKAANTDVARFRCVSLSGGAVSLAAADAAAIGVCVTDDPNANQAVGVQIDGIALIEVGTGGVTVDTAVELIGATTAAGCIKNYADGVKVGYALATGAAGEIVPVLLKPSYYAA